MLELLGFRKGEIVIGLIKVQKAILKLLKEDLL
jgi:hypothetical protein